MRTFDLSATPGLEPVGAHARRFRAEWWVLVAVQLAVATALAVSLLRDERTLLETEASRLEERARIVDHNLSHQLDGADKALNGVAGLIAELRSGSDPARLSDQLKLLTDAMPGFRSMLWLGPDGTVRASSSDPLLGRNFAEREYFLGPVRGGDPVRLYVSPPFLSTLGGQVVVVSRLLVDSQGAFDGVVTATLDPAYFGVLLRSVLHAPDMRAALVYGDDAVFLDVNGGAADAGRQVEVRHPLDRGEPLHEQKLTLRLSRDVPAVIAPWTSQVRRDVVLLVLAMLGSGGSLWLDQRRRRARFEDSASAQRRLEAVAGRVDHALRGADLGLWELHLPTRTLTTNARERAMLGYADSDEAPRGSAWLKMVHPEDRALVERAMDPHLAGTTPAFESEHRILRRDGVYIWVFSRAMVGERGPDGEPVRLVGTHLDITERKAAEARQRLSERRLRALTDHLPAIVAHHDLEQRYLTANGQHRRTFGIDPATMIGRTLRETRSEAACAQMAPHVARALRGETCRFEMTDRIDGIEHHFQHSFIPDTDDAGRVQGFYSMSFDITDLRHQERLLVDSTARHRQIVEEQSELVSLAREDGELVYVNPAYARHFGLTPAEMVGENLYDFIEPGHRAHVRALLAEVVATGTARSGDNRMVSADGQERWVAWTNTLQRDAHGVVSLRSVGRDVTEQRLAEQALRASQRFLLQTGRVAGIGGWELDLASEVLIWSEQVRRIHEVPDDYRPTLESALGFYAPEARPLIQAAVREGLDAGTSWDLELRLVTATGRSIWVRAVGDVEFADGKPARLAGAFQDITGRKAVEEALVRNERLVRTITDNLPISILYIDQEERLRFLNRGAESWSEVGRGTALGRPVAEVIGPVTYGARRSQIQRALGGETLQFEVDVKGPGGIRHVEQHYIPDRDEDGSVKGALAMIHDITDRKRIQQTLEELARVDTLTGLPNRRQFDERLGQALRRSRRNGEHVAVMYLDIDHFKSINDTLGHAGGDAVLKEFAARLKGCVRETDLPARLAGDEFVVLLEGLVVEDDARTVAEKVVRAMRVDFEVDGSPLRVTTSLGVGFSGDAAATAAEILACADKALYDAKRGGRDGFRLSNFGGMSSIDRVDRSSPSVHDGAGAVLLG